MLSPARDIECVKTALRFGADAVYVGGSRLQLRAESSGFTSDQLTEACRIVHEKGKHLYVTVNAFPENREIDELPDYARELKACGVDALIVSDLGAIAVLRKACPDLSIHVSTQANCLNYASANAYASMGVKRIVLGREMTLKDIAILREKTDPSLQLEAFIHGAMCMAYSGRCMISAALTGRSANRGACTQSCRWTYHLMEEKRPGQYFPVFEDDHGMTLLSSYDLCTLPFLDELIGAGIYSFKIEGRMKSAYYVAAVTNAYRKRLDDILYHRPSNVAFLMEELNSISHRTYGTGFYYSEAIHAMAAEEEYKQDCLFVGSVTGSAEKGRVRIQLRNRIQEGALIEVLSPFISGASFRAENIINDNGDRISCADRPSEIYEMDCPLQLEEGDLLRIRIHQL